MQKDIIEQKGHYDAFISYCHCDRDMAVAKKLHRMLEEYRIPKKIAEKTGKQRIDRVFRDREELSVSADLSARIQEALECSDHLIVICSPESKKSVWVQNEVEFFLRNHDVKDVLCLLTDGEPDDVFPEMVRHTKKTVIRDGHPVEEIVDLEPLAADVRAGTDPLRMKKLKEEYLRILAAILGCSYDDLRQRHQEQRLRHTLWLALLVAVVTTGFMTYAFIQNRRITAQYNRVLQEQAKYLARMALEELDKGHRERALQLSLAVESARDPDEPVVPEQVYPLNKALGIYSKQSRYQPAFTGEGGRLPFGKLTKGEDYYAALDTYSRPVMLDAENGKIYWELSEEDVDDLESNQFTNVIPTEAEQVLLFTASDMLLVDVAGKEILYHVKGDFSAADYTGSVCQSKGWFCNGTFKSNGVLQLVFYDIKTGEIAERAIVNWESGSKNSAFLSDLAFDEQGEHLYLLVSINDGEETVGELGVYDLKEKKISRKIRNVDTKEILPLSGGMIACIHRQESEGKMKDVWKNVRMNTWLSVRDRDLNEVFHSSKYLQDGGSGLYEDVLISGKEKRKVLYAWIGNQLIIWGIREQKTLEEFSFNNQIIQVCSGKNYAGCFAAMASGYTIWLQMSDYISRFRVSEINASVEEFTYNRKHDVLIQKTTDDVLFSSRLNDNKVRMISPGEEESIDTIESVDVAGRSFRYFLLKDRSDQRDILRVYKSGTEKALYSFKAQKDTEISDITFGDKEGKALLAFVEKKDSYSGSGERSYIHLHKISLDNGKVLMDEDLSRYETLDPYTLRFDPQLDMLAISREMGGAACLDISGNEAKPQLPAVFSMDNLEDLIVSHDGRYLLGTQGSYNQKLKIRIYDMQEETYVPREILLDDLTFYYKILPGKQTDVFAVFDGKDMITLYRFEDGEKVKEIHIDSSDLDNCSLEFFDGDRYMITSSKYSVSMWDLSGEKIVMTWNDSEPRSKEIMTGDDSSCFGIYYGSWSERRWQDTGITLPNYVLFSVDDQHRFTPVFEVEMGRYSFCDREVFWDAGGKIAFRPRCEFRELKALALEILDGLKLSEAESQGYYINQDH